MTEIKITVNGEEIYLTEFPKEIIISVLLGMLNTLKGVKDIKEAKIELEVKK